MKKIIICFLLLLAPGFIFAELPIGEKPSALVIDGDNGGRLDGTAWSSEELMGNITTIMYVDPDEKDLNAHVEDALKALNLPVGALKSVAVINLAASWKPNWAIESILEGKQEKFPNTVYVKDLKGTLVKNWGLLDDSYDVLLIDREGKVLFSKDGELSAEDVKKLTSLVLEHI